MFTPPSLGRGTLTYPGTVGGVEWGGGAVDPVAGGNSLLSHQLSDQLIAFALPVH